MNQTQAGYILPLAWFLRTQVPAERFDMDIRVDGDLHECGTSACALGWGTIAIPEVIVAATAIGFRVRGYVYRCDYYEQPICDAFGITREEATHAFGAKARTPKQAAKVLEDLALKYGWEYA